MTEAELERSQSGGALGKNQPDFQSLQLDFTAHIRHPDRFPIPHGIESRRMAVYVRLIYNNIEDFCATRFSRTKSILGEQDWHALIRDFVHRHQSSSPYFSQISEEFISFLALERTTAGDPNFLLELCHFEWLSLYLDRLNETVPPFSACDEPLTANLVCSPLAVTRKYQWPVNKLAPDYIPNTPPDEPTWVLAHRDRADRVHMRITQPTTAVVAERFREPTSANKVVDQLVKESSAPAKKVEQRLEQILFDLIDLDVLLVHGSNI